jgi:hypothetical protein
MVTVVHLSYVGEYYYTKVNQVQSWHSARELFGLWQWKNLLMRTGP